MSSQRAINIVCLSSKNFAVRSETNDVSGPCQVTEGIGLGHTAVLELEEKRSMTTTRTSQSIGASNAQTLYNVCC
jgi:hypothetical protein